MAKIVGMDGKQSNTPQNPMAPKLSLTDSKPIKCTKCGYDVFLPATKYRTISKLLAGSEEDVLIPIQIDVCAACGTIEDRLLPKELKAIYKNEENQNSMATSGTGDGSPES